MSTLLNCWDNYQRCRIEIEQHFRQHDPEDTGRLDTWQLRGLLTELSGGLTVSNEEVDWVMRQSDILKNGVITKPELRRVLALWDARLKADQHCCGVQ